MSTPGLGDLNVGPGSKGIEESMTDFANVVLGNAKDFSVPGTKPFRPLTYLACPYSDPDPARMEQRYKQVTEAAAWMITRNGWNVFSPITHSHPLAVLGKVQGDWAFWKKFDTDYIKCAERFVILEIPGWRKSTGVREETQIAIDLRIPIRYIHWDLAAGSWQVTTVPAQIGENPSAAEPPTTTTNIVCSVGPGVDFAKWTQVTGSVRQFETGATRDTEEGKFDYEGFLCPQVMEQFGAYMHKHRKQSDGKLRDSDNWQKGIPRKAYMKSIWRHLVQLWKRHRGLETRDEKGNLVTIEKACCALLFNVQGYLFEYLAKR